MRRTKPMGEAIARLKFQGLRRAETVTLELLVDTGSTFSWIDGRVLKALGVRRAHRWRFHTIEGRRISRDVGHAFVEYRGWSAPTAVVFAGRTTNRSWGSTRSRASAYRSIRSPVG